MKTYKFLITIFMLVLALATANAAGEDPNAVTEPNDIGVLPANFPAITAHIYDSNAIGEGYVFLAVAVNFEGVGHYLMIIENDGTPIWYREAGHDEIYDFKVLPNGLLHYSPFIVPHSYAGGGDTIHTLMDEDFNIVEEVHPGNGYVAEAHDFQLMPNGNILLFGYYLSQVDMSNIVPDGYPNALVSGSVVQELDSQRHVVFQWRTWDYHTFEDFFPPLMDDARVKSAVINTFHVNTLSMDNDGHIIIASPQPAAKLPKSGWVKKINRQTGEIMWTLGGEENQFTFVGVTEAEGIEAFTGHAFHRIENGNVLIYDNGDTKGKRSSQVHEYILDEENKVATHIWTYTPDMIISGTGRGNAQRLPNGNTMICWGTPATGKTIPAATEVTQDGRKVWELYFDNPVLNSYRAFRFVFPSQLRAIEAQESDLATGNTYDFGETGVSLTILSGGGGYNEVVVVREPYAPVYPDFPGKAPRVLPVRVQISGSEITSISATLSFDVESFGFVHPDNLTVCHRESPGQGVFTPCETSYNPATKKLRATMTGFGEFIFSYPDLDDVALAPILNEPESYRGIQEYEVIAPVMAEQDKQYTVNEELPISLSWSLKGLARWYELQIATSQDFADSVVDVSHLTDACYVWEVAAPSTTYFYRVRTCNDGGTSEWSTGSFQTVPPMVKLTIPNGGESWKKGLSYFIQWIDNIAEDTVIELYKGEVSVETIATVPSTGAYKWEVNLALEPGEDYSIKIKSAVDNTIVDVSDAPFTITNVAEVQQ